MDEGSAGLVVERLNKSFGGVRVAEDISFGLGRSDMLCLVGPNGCGKTTFFNMITGFVRPDSGSLRFGQLDLAAGDPIAIARSGIARKFQVPAVFADLTVADNLAVAHNAPARDHGGRSGEAVTEIDRLLARVGLGDEAGQLARHLSHGQKQWLEIAMVLACRPRLMLLDEPTAGMTRAETMDSVALIRELHESTGTAMLMIEHDMGFVRALGCPVAVMLQGRIVAQGSFDEVSALAEVREAYLGPAHA